MKGKIWKYIKHPFLLLLYFDRHGFLKIGDKLFLRLAYYEALGKKLNLKNPVTFNEKLQWLKLYDNNPRYVSLVDKSRAKLIVKRLIGSQYIIPTLGVYNNFSEIQFDSLPEKFVIKCTHDSGSVVVCNDKKKLDIKQAEETINECLKRNYFRVAREWPYKKISPRIIVEKYIDSLSGDIVDYKMMCFGGKVRYIFTCTERFSKEGLKVTWFDTNWNRLNFERHYPASKKIIKKPDNLNKMIALAEKLSSGIPFVRIDFYNIGGKILFGEYTFYPGAGFKEFTPDMWDRKLGDLITLPEKRHEK